MSRLPKTLDFEGTRITIIDRDGKPWLSAADLARALGYSRSDMVTQIYSRHADEFTDEMTQVIDIPRSLKTRFPENNDLGDDRNSLILGNVKMTFPENNGLHDNGGASCAAIRIFSPRGCHLIAMLARTPRAKAFRRWVLDVLEGLTRGGAGGEARADVPRGTLRPPCEGSGFLAVEVDGIRHLVYPDVGPVPVARPLLVAVRPVAQAVGVGWAEMLQTVWHSGGVSLPGCETVPPRWDCVMVSDPVGDEVEPDSPLGPRVVTCVPLHLIAALVATARPEPAAVRYAAWLSTVLLTAWNAHLGAGLAPAPALGAWPAPAGAVPQRAWPAAALPQPGCRAGERLAAEEVEAVRRLRRAGLSVQAIARELGRAQQTVRWLLRGMEVWEPELRVPGARPLRGLGDARLIALHARWRAGERLAALAREAGVPADLLSLAFRGMGHVEALAPERLDA